MRRAQRWSRAAWRRAAGSLAGGEVVCGHVGLFAGLEELAGVPSFEGLRMAFGLWAVGGYDPPSRPQAGTRLT